MVIWVAGGRNFNSESFVREALRPYASDDNLLVEGGARGADSLARDIWVGEWELPCLTIPAQWTKYGRAAGPRRNRVIADGQLVEPDILIAFSGGRGTANAVARAELRDIPVVKAGNWKENL